MDTYPNVGKGPKKLDNSGSVKKGAEMEEMDHHGVSDVDSSNGDTITALEDNSIDDTSKRKVPEDVEWSYLVITEDELVGSKGKQQGGISASLSSGIEQSGPLTASEGEFHQEEYSLARGMFPCPVDSRQEFVPRVNTQGDISSDDTLSCSLTCEGSEPSSLGNTEPLNNTDDVSAKDTHKSDNSISGRPRLQVPLVRVKSAVPLHSDVDVFQPGRRKRGRNRSLPILPGAGPRLNHSELTMLENVLSELWSEPEDAILLEKPIFERRKSSLPGVVSDTSGSLLSNQVIIQWYIILSQSYYHSLTIS